MVKWKVPFGRFQKAKVVVIGDFMLDTYTFGTASRMSPEAPVPVLHVREVQNLPGGAGNVVLNLKALGAQVISIGRVGEDTSGFLLKELLEKKGIETEGIFVQKGGKTLVKNRLIANGQQLIRVDDEEIVPLPLELEEEIKKRIAISIEECDVIAISDYGKGFLSNSLLSAIFELGKKRDIPVLVDPKGDDFTKYAGATLIKPNAVEAYKAAKRGVNTPLSIVGSDLLVQTQVEKILITRSEKGMTLFEKGGKSAHFPAKTHEVKDGTGAGDTVLAIISMAFASGIPLSEGLYLANVGAGIAIEQVGCASISFSSIMERLLKTDVAGKVFDEGHLFILEQVLKEKRVTILGLLTEGELSNSLFAKIQSLAGKGSKETLLIYLADNRCDEVFLALLSSLQEVDFIVKEEGVLSALCTQVTPAQVLLFEEEELIPSTIEQLVGEYAKS